jgi:hypothetical protein
MLGIACCLVLALAGACLVRLNRRCRVLQRHKEAWKTYALAVEAIFECDLDLSEAATDRETARFERQCQNAEEAVMDAGRVLYNLGEYPEAYGCSPFLPSDPRLHDWCRSHIR